MLKTLVTFLLINLSLQAQGQLILLLQEKSTLEIPFDLRKDLILVDVILEDIPLRFIFDTGAENNILFHKELCQIMEVDFDDTIMLRGRSLQDSIPAHIIRSLDITLSKLPKTKTDLIVLDHAPGGLSNFIGEEIHGILGASFFGNFVIEVNYRTQKIRFHTSEKWAKIRSKKMNTKEIHVINRKAYINMPVEINAKKKPLDLLIDSGASIHLLLHQNTFKELELPEKLLNGVIGAGISGDVMGYIGRISNFEFCNTIFNNQIVAFQFLDPIISNSGKFHRNGLVGNKLLQRYHWAIDYSNEKFYYKPRNKRTINRAFLIDKSGLEIILGGEELNMYLIHYVRENSPASEAGFQAKDEIIRINGWPSSLYSLDHINKILSKKVGTRLSIVLKRNGVKYRKDIYLKNLI